MPYTSVSELPDNVKSVLPSAAQSIFLKVFNAAFKKYGDVSARKIAWSAVKKAGYKKGTDDKGNDKWVKESVTISLIATSSQWAQESPQASSLIVYEGSIDKDGLSLSDIDTMEFDNPHLILASIMESNNGYMITAVKVHSDFELPINLTTSLSKSK